MIHTSYTISQRMSYVARGRRFEQSVQRVRGTFEEGVRTNVYDNNKISIGSYNTNSNSNKNSNIKYN